MRSLSPEEANLWGQVMATVRPLRAAAVTLPVLPPRSSREPVRASSTRPAMPASATAPVRAGVGGTLDGGWDRRISRGLVAPDVTIDLHGHTLSSAHGLLDAGLERAIARGDRVMLLVTGKPPRPESERPHVRGAIRAVVSDWIAASRHAGAIAAVRGAHPRHGGQGALYIVFRRKR